jgi:hypothetical protein
MMKFDTNALPPKSGAKFLCLIQPRPGRPVVGFIGAPHLSGVYFHWDATITIHRHNGHIWHGKSVACRLPAARCAYCDQGHERKWVGYLPLWDDHHQRWIIGEVTPYALEHEARLHPISGPNLLGYELRLERGDGWAQNAVRAYLSSGPLKSTGLSEPPDVHCWLCRLYGIQPDEPVWQHDDADPLGPIPFPGKGA